MYFDSLTGDVDILIDMTPKIFLEKIFLGTSQKVSAIMEIMMSELKEFKSKRVADILIIIDRPSIFDCHAYYLLKHIYISRESLCLFLSIPYF